MESTLTPDNLFWYFLNDVVKLQYPHLQFPDLSIEDQTAVVQKVLNSVNLVMSMLPQEGGGGEGGEGGGPQMPSSAGRLVHLTDGGMPRMFVNLGEQTEPSTPLPTGAGATGLSIPYQGGCAIVNYGPVSFTIDNEHLTQMFNGAGQMLLKTTGEPENPMLPDYRLDWVDVTSVTIDAGTMVILRPKPQELEAAVNPLPAVTP